MRMIIKKKADTVIQSNGQLGLQDKIEVCNFNAFVTRYIFLIKSRAILDLILKLSVFDISDWFTIDNTFFQGIEVIHYTSRSGQNLALST